MPDFSQRSVQPEVMDDLAISGYDLEQSLKELAVINRWLGGHRVLKHALNSLQPWLQSYQHSPRIADLACGGGDLLAFVENWAYKRHITPRLYGYDANPNVIALAKQWYSNSAIRFDTQNVFDPAFQQQTFDVVLLTLFVHHLPDDVLVDLLKQLKQQTTTAVVINDLQRHPLAYYSIQGLTQLFSKTSMVKADGPLSVLRAFHKSELTRLLKAAGFSHFTIQWQWAFRWQVVAFTDNNINQ